MAWHSRSTGSVGTLLLKVQDKVKAGQADERGEEVAGDGGATQTMPITHLSQQPFPYPGTAKPLPLATVYSTREYNPYPSLPITTWTSTQQPTNK